MEQLATHDDVRRLYLAHAAEVRQAVARLAPMLDADDVLHEVFVIALSKPRVMQRVSSPRAWLFGIAVKLAATRRRTSKLRQFFGLDEASSHAATDAPSRSAEQRDAQRMISLALESVSAVRRETFVLFELQGLSGDEIAEALGIPLKTVWTRLFHARREVTRAIERQLVSEQRTSGLSREELLP